MPDLAQHIRERLEGWAPPLGDEPPNQFVEVVDPGDLTPEQVEQWHRRWDEVVGTAAEMQLHVLTTAPRFYPGFEQMRAALLTVVDLHVPAAAPFSGECKVCGAYFEYPVRWPCPTFKGIAQGLGIEV